MVTVATSLSAIPVAQSVFAIESLTLAAQNYHVMSVAENFSDTEMKYDSTAVKHVAGKFAAIHNGAQIVLPTNGLWMLPFSCPIKAFRFSSVIPRRTKLTAKKVLYVVNSSGSGRFDFRK